MKSATYCLDFKFIGVATTELRRVKYEEVGGRKFEEQQLWRPVTFKR